MHASSPTDLQLLGLTSRFQRKYGQVNQLTILCWEYCVLTYVHVQSGERSKLDSRSRKCICLGLESSVKGYRLWDPASKKNIVSKDVVFDEAYMLRKGVKHLLIAREGNRSWRWSLMNNIHSQTNVMTKNHQKIHTTEKNLTF